MPVLGPLLVIGTYYDDIVLRLLYQRRASLAPCFAHWQVGTDVCASTSSIYDDVACAQQSGAKHTDPTSAKLRRVPTYFGSGTRPNIRQPLNSDSRLPM
jgi:hypothetical protein